MQISSKYTVALHAMLAIAYYQDKQKVTSTFLSKSTGADATIIRHILSDLRTAGYVSVRPGVGGASLNKPLSDITALDIFKTVITPEDCMFRFYENPNGECVIGQNIHEILDSHLSDFQHAIYKKMEEVNLQDLYEKMIIFMPN